MFWPPKCARFSGESGVRVGVPSTRYRARPRQWSVVGRLVAHLREQRSKSQRIGSARRRALAAPLRCAPRSVHVHRAAPVQPCRPAPRWAGRGRAHAQHQPDHLLRRQPRRRSVTVPVSSSASSISWIDLPPATDRNAPSSGPASLSGHSGIGSPPRAIDATLIPSDPKSRG